MQARFQVHTCVGDSAGITALDKATALPNLKRGEVGKVKPPNWTTEGQRAQTTNRTGSIERKNYIGAEQVARSAGTWSERLRL